jgi:hypothetical protein
VLIGGDVFSAMDVFCFEEEFSSFTDIDFFDADREEL